MAHASRSARSAGSISARCCVIDLPGFFGPPITLGWLDRLMASLAGRRASLYIDPHANRSAPFSHIWRARGDRRRSILHRGLHRIGEQTMAFADYT
jgi:hypothetical protein